MTDQEFLHTSTMTAIATAIKLWFEDDPIQNIDREALAETANDTMVGLGYHVSKLWFEHDNEGDLMIKAKVVPNESHIVTYYPNS